MAQSVPQIRRRKHVKPVPETKKIKLYDVLHCSETSLLQRPWCRKVNSILYAHKCILMKLKLKWDIPLVNTCNKVFSFFNAIFVTLQGRFNAIPDALANALSCLKLGRGNFMLYNIRTNKLILVTRKKLNSARSMQVCKKDANSEVDCPNDQVLLFQWKISRSKLVWICNWHVAQR